MKKNKLTGKLNFTKETVSKLNDKAMNSLKGGVHTVQNNFLNIELDDDDSIVLNDLDAEYLLDQV